MKNAFEPLSMRKLGCEVICETLKLSIDRLGKKVVEDILELSNIDIAQLVRACPKSVDVFELAHLEWVLASRRHLPVMTASAAALIPSLY